ncbi:YdeI/OmpD-associated family protein, partial [Nocardioides sp. YIM 152588]|uniref:YdeI/OmpD-associated family protein n=1 Tax=Nocardioides sp. YIM 152588 TaxID=3158259 RepID=UPI0032E4C623
MSPARPTEILDLPDAAAWEDWLERHHATADEAWLRIGKKNSGLTTVTFPEALEGALCFGWIDGMRRGLDEVSFIQRYCPRRRRSTWSQINVEKVVALTADGRMRPAGLAQVEAARADGRWDAAYERQATATVPDDLRAALDADPAAAAAFDALGRSDQYGVMLPVLRARDDEARVRAVEREVRKLRGGRRGRRRRCRRGHPREWRRRSRRPRRPRSSPDPRRRWSRSPRPPTPHGPPCAA